jgi:hypothetical protein
MFGRSAEAAKRFCFATLGAIRIARIWTPSHNFCAGFRDERLPSIRLALNVPLASAGLPEAFAIKYASPLRPIDHAGIPCRVLPSARNRQYRSFR